MFLNFYCRNFRKKQVFALGRPFQLSLMLLGKERSLSSSGAPKRRFTRAGWVIQPGGKFENISL
jgi:hypothetical protein